MLQLQPAAMARSSKDYREPGTPQSQRPRMPRPASYDSTTSYDSVHSAWSSASASSTYVHAPSIYTLESAFSTDAQRPDSPDGYPSTPYDIPPPFHVLALYDFASDDPAHISFQKNDVFEIVAIEPSGWWAAQIGVNVGWVPMSFVGIIQPGLVDSFLKAPHDDREQLYASYEDRQGLNPEIDGESYPGVDRSAPPLEDPYDEVQVSITPSELRSPPIFPTDVTPFVTSRFDIPPYPSLPIPPGSLPNPWPSRPHPYATAPQTPRTPRTPVPPRGPAPAPTANVDVPRVAQSTRARLPLPRVPQPLTLKVDTKFNRDKPTPPTPVATTPASTTPASATPASATPASATPSQMPSSTKSAYSPPKKTLGLPRTGSLGSNSTSPAPRRRAIAPIENSSNSMRNPNITPVNDTPVVPITLNPDEIDDISTRDNIPPPRIRGGDKIRRITGEDEAQAFHNAKLAQAALPWYLKPEHIGDEVKLDHDGRVNAGTLEALVERLTVEPLRLEHEESYRHTFLTTFHSFTTADRVVELLIYRYEMDSPTDLADDQFTDWKLQKLRPTQARVLHVFCVWVSQYGLMQDDAQVAPRLRDFLELINSPSPHAQVAKKVLANIERHRTSDINIRPFAPIQTPSRRMSKAKNGYKSDFLKLDHNDLARQLTLYEARLYLKIRPHECIAWGSMQKGEGVRNMRSFVSTSDKLAAWVKMSVLNNDALGRRADTIDMWIKVAEKCRLFNNYSSMSAIVAALMSQVIAKLHLTWAHVHRASHIEPLMKLFEPTSNFNTYRNLFTELGNASLPCLPYIGIYLSDMVKTYETLPNNVDVITTEADVPPREIRLINFIKYRKMTDVVQSILRHQPKVREYKISELQHVMQFIETQLSTAASKDEGGFWMRSQEVQHAELAHADIRKGLEAAGF